MGKTAFRGRAIAVALLGIAVLGASIYAFRQPIFCNVPVIPFGTSARFTVAVPDEQTAAFNGEVTSFMRDYGLAFDKATFRTSVPATNELYTAHLAIGCDGNSRVWSSNSNGPHQYLVTFHHNPIFGDQTKPLSDAFVTEFRSHYDVRPYTGWHPEAPSEQEKRGALDHGAAKVRR